MKKKWYPPHLKSGRLKKQLPIQWIMLLHVVVIALVILTGSVLVFSNIEKAREQNRQNLIQSLEAVLLVGKMIEQHIPLRKLVARQKILVERFTYEFEIFVLEETGDIEQLEKSVNRMLANQLALEAAWAEGLAREPLERLPFLIGTGTPKNCCSPARRPTRRNSIFPKITVKSQCSFQAPPYTMKKEK